MKIRAEKLRFFDIIQSLMSHITKSISGALSYLLLVTLISFGMGLSALGIPASASSNCYWAPVPGQPGNYTLEGDLSNCVIAPPPSTNTPPPPPAPTPSETAMPKPTPTLTPVEVTPPAPAPTQQPVPVVASTPTPTPTLNAEEIARADAAEKAKKAAEALAKLQAAAADLEKANNDLQRATDEAQAALDKISPRTAVNIVLTATSAKINENSPARLVATLSDAKATGSVRFNLEVTGRPELKREICSGSIVDSAGTASCNFFTLVNLTNQESYKITAKYSGDTNYAAFETTLTFPVSKLEVVKPCQPDIEALSNGDSSVSLFIELVVNSRCGLPTSYQVREFTSERVLCETTTLSCILTGLTNGTSVELYLVALNSAGTSNSVPDGRKKIVGNPIGKPLPPALAIARTINSSKIRVTWQGGTTDGGSPLTSFVATSNDGTLQCSNLLSSRAEKEANMFSCDISKPVAGQKYSFTVKAINKFGSSVASAPTFEVATSATAIENFEHKVFVGGGFVVQSIKLSELGNSENQITCVRASSCSLIVPKGSKWEFTIEDEFAHKIIDSKTNLQVSENDSLDSISDTNLVVNTEQERSLIVSGRTNKIVPLKRDMFNIVDIVLEFGAYSVIAPLFTPSVEPTRGANDSRYRIPTGMNFLNGRYFGIPTSGERVSDLFKIDGTEFGIFFIISKFSYAAPDAVSLTANGDEVSYVIKPSSSNTLRDVTNRADKWEVVFFDSQSNQFLSKICSSTLTGKVVFPKSSSLYAKAFSGCTEMKEANYENYKISDSSVESNAVSTIPSITFAALSGLTSKVDNKYVGKILNLSFEIQPDDQFVLVPSSPMKVTSDEISKFASLMNGLTIDSGGKISGSISPEKSGIFASSSWKKLAKFGGYEVYFDVTLTLSTLVAGELSVVKVGAPLANTQESFGKIEFNYKPSYVGDYRFTLEMETVPYVYSDLSNPKCNQADKSKGCVVIVTLGTQDLNFTSLVSSKKVISFSSRAIDLPGYVVNSQSKELFQPYNLPVAVKYRIRVEALNISVTPGNIFLDKSAVNYSSNIDLVWPKKSAPMLSRPTVEATSKSGEIAVGGWVSSLWNYPEEPVSISVVACKLKFYPKGCTTTVFDSFETIVNSMGSKGILLIKGLKNEDYRVSITFNMDPKSIEYETGPSSYQSAIVKPKK